MEGGDTRGGREETTAMTTTTLNGDCLGDLDRSRNGERSKAGKVCRICHFGKEIELIQLGCDCKGELGSSHQHCAQSWFSQKGDRLCEICGKTAKNIKNNAEETSIFMMEWDQMRVVAASLDASWESTRRCELCFCSFVLAAVVLLFMLLWFFRGINVL